MQSTNLVNGKKGELLDVFRSLKKVHGRKWPALLRKHNPWYDTRVGSNAWENASRSKSNIGNEALRQLIADMQEIISKTSKKSILQRQGLTRRVKA